MIILFFQILIYLFMGKGAQYLVTASLQIFDIENIHTANNRSEIYNCIMHIYKIAII